MKYKLTRACFIITFIQFFIVNLTDSQNVVRVEWTKPQYFCGTFLEDLMNEICRGEIISPRYLSLTTECCRKKCTASKLKQQHCNDNSPDHRPFIYVSKRNGTLNSSNDGTITSSTWDLKIFNDFVSQPYKVLQKFIRHPMWMFT